MLILRALEEAGWFAQIWHIAKWNILRISTYLSFNLRVKIIEPL